jgi:hypothetical protein
VVGERRDRERLQLRVERRDEPLAGCLQHPRGEMRREALARRQAVAAADGAGGDRADRVAVGAGSDRVCDRTRALRDGRRRSRRRAQQRDEHRRLARVEAGRCLRE